MPRSCRAASVAGFQSRTGVPAMTRRLFPWIVHPALALGSTLLWGAIEFVALCRCRLGVRRSD